MDSIKIKNLTPHTITILKSDGSSIEIPSDGVARVITNTVGTGEIETDKGVIPVSKTEFSDSSFGLPEPDGETIYIVSNILCQANPDRDDLYIVNESVRDGHGRIVGVRSISKNPYLNNL